MTKMTINDIAKAVGVSKSTVSRALNDTGYVSKKLKDQILQIVAENDYQPSALARGLSKQNSSTIGVIIPELASTFFGQILQGISEEADKNGFAVMYCSTDNSPAKELKAIQTLSSQQISGLLLTPSFGPSEFEESVQRLNALEKLGVPVILIDRTIKKSQWDGVYFDNYNGAYMLCEALIKSGAKTIGAIVSDLRMQLGIDRYEGFRQAMIDHQCQLDERYVCRSEQIITMDQAYHMAIKAIKSNRLPQALLLSNRIIAKGVFKALLEHGIMPGRDIQCASFDNVEALDILNIQYMYLNRNAVNMGRIAAEMLLQQFEQSDRLPRREYVIPAELVTTGEPPRKT